MIFKKRKNVKQTASTARKKGAAKGKASQHQSKKTASKRRKKGTGFFTNLFYLLLFCVITLGLVGLLGVWILGKQLDKEYQLGDGALDGVLWELPSRVYARPLELYVSKRLTLANLITELGYLNYKSDSRLSKPGTYAVNDNQVLIYKNGFHFWDNKEPEKLIRITLSDDKITELMDMNELTDIAITRLEPLLIGSIYPKNGQDRILISLEETPPVLVDTILATEDRRFYSHPGLDFKGLVRAIVQGIKKGRLSQGASTLTQQFVKNHYLTRKRAISRKVKEAIIAVILEYHYSKKQILEGYLNEIFLGQDGGRAIHGFGLAAEFYFGKPLKELSVHQIASLVALIREPVRANPFRHPEYAKRRRGLVLDVMVSQKLISAQEANIADSLPLDTVNKAKRKKKERYFSFLQLVKSQLSKEYDQKSLSEGLNIFTTLDPTVQDEVERSIKKALPRLEKRRGLKSGFLQVASVIVNTATAEVVAIVGDRDSERKGFNRAIMAKRQPGSLLKPVVYLAALEYPQKYTLTTMIDDSPLVYRSGGETWSPKNYSKRNRGRVPLINGLVHSYNIPTARIALDIGIDDFIGRLEDLGARKGLPKYPSIVLGSVAMTPLEVAQVYESLANGGYRMPLRAITSITDAYNRPVEHYDIKSTKVISDEPYYLIIKAMQDIVKRGTAARLKSKISADLHIAGKTGTTDDYRDSWFAGFSGNYLNVVWVGNDDNKRTGLSGSNGAMRVWMDIMKGLPLKPLSPLKPASVEEVNVDLSTGLLASSNCAGNRTEVLPFIVGTAPTYFSRCYLSDPSGNNIINLGSPSANSPGSQNGGINLLWYNQSLDSGN